jgi:predicted tellurium resistance membrane protein TerC
MQLAEPQAVTSIEESPYQERRSRFIKYTIAMVIRVICIVLAVAIPLGWWTFIFVAGAVFLPYFAVVIANAQGPGAPTKRAATAEAPTLSISADAFRTADSSENG